MHISRGADTGLSVHWSVHCSLLKILWFVLSHYSDFDICGLMWNVWTNIRWIAMVFSADIDAPLKMNRYNFPRLFSWACFIHPIKLSHQIQCIQLSVWYLILLKHQQQHRVWLMWIRSGSLNVFLVVMLNSDCSLHTSEESIDTTVKQSPSYLPVHNFPHLLKSACNEIGRGTFALFAKKKILWNFTAYWFKAVSSTFTLSCVRGFDLATSPLRVL